MRLKIALVAVVGISLLILGFRPDGLPYLRHEARFSDAVLAHWPNAFYLRESVLARGEFPLWRETTMAGQPFAANPLNKTAYPFQWLVVLFPPVLHLNLLIVFHLLVAGGGMWCWARSLGLRTEAAAFSTLAYVLAPRVIGHTGAGHLDVLYAMAWWPWLMWAISRMRADHQGHRVNALGLALFAALVFLADVRVSLFAFTTAAVFAFLLVGREKRWKPLGWYALAGIVFLPLAASVFIPLVIWQPYLNRASLSLSDAGVLALEPIHLLGLILPAHRPSVETLTYLGLPVLTLGVIGIVSFPRRVRFAWIGALSLAGLYAIGANAPVWSMLVRLLPGLLWFRVPSKAWLILVLLLPLLAGYGLQWLLAQIGTGKKFRRLELSIVMGTAMAAATGIFAVFILRLPPTMGISALVGGLLLGGILLLILNHHFSAYRAALLLVVLLCLDLVWTGYQWVDWRNEAVWLDPGRPLAERLLELGADRVYFPTYSLEQQVAEAYHLRLFGGVDPFQLQGVVDAIEQGSGVQIDGYSVVMPPVAGATGDDLLQANHDAIINTPILADWDVSHVVAAYAIDHPRLEYVDTVNDVYLYRNLDYQASTQPITIPDWPTGWPGLPDQSTVARLNQITRAAALVSGMAFIIYLIILILSMTILRRKRV